jgi:hypothetical protein
MQGVEICRTFSLKSEETFKVYTGKLLSPNLALWVKKNIYTVIPSTKRYIYENVDI